MFCGKPRLIPPWLGSSQRAVTTFSRVKNATPAGPYAFAAETIQAEFGISQPAVSQHLRVLRESGFALSRAEGTRRLYAIEPSALQEADVWLDQFRKFWNQHLDALATELARGRRDRSITATPKATDTGTPQAHHEKRKNS